MLDADQDGIPELMELALEAGYSDQSHFNRDFLEIAGMTPQAYRRAAPTSPHHVPARFNFVQDRGRAHGQNEGRTHTCKGGPDGHS